MGRKSEEGHGPQVRRDDGPVAQSDRDVVGTTPTDAGDQAFRTLFELAADAILIVTPGAGRILEANDAACQLLGWTAEELVRLSRSNLVDPQDSRVADLLAARGRAGRSTGSVRCVRKDGTRFEADVITFNTVRLHDRQEVSVTVLRDVSVREEAEQARREALARLEKIAAHVPGVVYQYQLWPDGHSAFPFASHGIRRIYGVDPASVATDASPAFAVLHPDDRQRVTASIMDSARQLTTWHEEYRVKLPDGRMIWVEGISSPERQPDGSTLWHGYIRDITDRKEAEREIKKLSLAVEQSPESIVITNLDASIEYVNETFVAKTGYARDEVVGRNPRLLHSGRTPPSTFRDMWAALMAGRSWTGEFVNRRKDGTEFTELATISPIRDTDGTIARYVAVKEDITERKRDQEELDRYRSSLESLVEERTRELAVARDEAQSANREKSAFLANISHEIRTPLNAIIGFTDLLLAGGAGEINDEQQRQLAIVSNASRHLLALISDVLDISRIEAGQLTVGRDPFLLGDTVTRAVETLRPAASAKSLRLAYSVPPEPAVALGDERRTYQVLINLLSNAVKFTERGGVRVDVVASGDRELMVEVSDTGIGISPEDQARLFQPFRQLGHGVARRQEGVGLGLAISRRLIELQGGRIWVESTPGAGTTFRFTLPVLPAQD